VTITVFAGIFCPTDLLTGSQELLCSREFLVQLIYWRDLKNSLSRWSIDDYCVRGNTLSNWSTDRLSRITVFAGIICPVDLLTGSQEILCSREFFVQLIYWRDLNNYCVRGNSLSKWCTNDYYLRGNFLSSWSTDGISRITVFAGIPCPSDVLTITNFAGISCPVDLQTGSPELLCSREFFVQLIYWRALKNYCVRGNSLSSWSTDGLSRITVFAGIPCPSDVLTITNFAGISFPVDLQTGS